MPVVYLVSSANEILALDSTTSVTKTQQNSVTSSSVMSKRQVADGYTIGNPSISFSGICSYQKMREDSQVPTPLELDKIVQGMINSKQRFTLYGNTLISDLQDVVITSYQLTQDLYQDAITASFTVEQVFTSTAATRTTVIVPTETAKEEIPTKIDAGAGDKTDISNLFNSTDLIIHVADSPFF